MDKLSAFAVRSKLTLFLIVIKHTYGFLLFSFSFYCSPFTFDMELRLDFFQYVFIILLQRQIISRLRYKIGSSCDDYFELSYKIIISYKIILLYIKCYPQRTNRSLHRVFIYFESLRNKLDLKDKRNMVCQQLQGATLLQWFQHVQI